MRATDAAMLVLGAAACGFEGRGHGGDSNVIDASPSSSADAAQRVYRNCADALAAGITTSGVLEIDPDGDGDVMPFQVYCDMTTAGGGWTLVYAYRFTPSQEYGPAAVTPRPTWPRPASGGTPTSITPPLAPTTPGAIDFALWSTIGADFLADSTINSTLACTPGGGSLVTLTQGSVSCTMINAVDPSCASVVSKNLAVWNNGPLLKTATSFGDANDVQYFWDGGTTENFPTHDPCAMDTLAFPITNADPRGAIYLR